jgi:hypothetical protein
VKTGALANVIHFVLEASEELPARKRAALYLDLASICGDEQEAANLRELSDQLLRTDQLCREFTFSFSQKVHSEVQKLSKSN